MLERVQLRDPRGALDRHPHEFSGGMRQRIMLASVLMMRPALLIADEPTTALDAVIQAEVMELMSRLVEAEGTALILVSHDLPLVAQHTARAVILKEGRAVEAGPTARILAAPRDRYTRRLVDALPRPRAGRGRTTPPVVEARGVRVVFEGRRRFPLVASRAGGRRGRRRHRHPRGRGRGPRGRERVGQDHARARAPRPRADARGRGAARRRAAPAGLPPPDADRLPGPLCQPRPPDERCAHRLGRAAPLRAEGRRGRAAAGRDPCRRPASARRLRGPATARAVGRAAPKGVHRQRAGHPSPLRGGRRAGLGPRPDRAEGGAVAPGGPARAPGLLPASSSATTWA